MADRVLRITQLKKQHERQVGSKAYRLGELSRHGFHVPSGFVIPASLCQSLRNKPRSQWPSALLKKIEVELNRLFEHYDAVAVRSSALAEDSSQLSYAGQYQTVLHVSNFSQCLAAINTVMASAEAEHIAVYQQYHHQEEVVSQVAILIQGMVQGDFSGVIFSQNIMQSKPDTLLLEAASRRAGGVVDGEDLVEQVIIDRATGTIKEQIMHQEKLVDEAAAKVLCQFTLKVEALFHQSMDIEYLYSDSGVTVLQARPITTLLNAQTANQDEFAPPTGRGVIWTCHNVQEAFPKVMSPFTMSIWQAFINDALNRHQVKLGIKSRLETTWLFGYFYSKVHANVSLARRLSDRILGQDPDTITQSYLGKVLPYPDRERALTRWYYRIKSTPFTNYYSLRLPKIIPTLHRKITRQTHWLSEQSLGALNDKSLVKLHERLIHHYSGYSVGYHITVFTLPTLAVNLLTQLLTPVFAQHTPVYINVLISGLTQVESAQISAGIWQLSRIANDHQLPINSDFKPVDPDLPEAWTDAYNAFIARHGHRGSHELAFEAKVWRDDPSSLMKLIMQQMPLDSSHSPLTKNEEARRLRLLLTEDIQSKLGWIRRRVFNIVLSKAQQWTALRELSKSTEAKGLRLLDPIYAEMQARLLRRGHIDEAEDFWMLTFQEIVDTLQSSRSISLRPTVNRRKKTLRVNQMIHLPEYFYGYPKPIKPQAVSMTDTVLQGVAVNGGVVRGKARVITQYDKISDLEPGEILVTHISDAAWTPLFTLAAGVVVDIGSLLSHSSIIAREFGLPAVINVKTATRLIQTGDMITVDGDLGQVVIEGIVDKSIHH